MFIYKDHMTHGLVFLSVANKNVRFMWFYFGLVTGKGLKCSEAAHAEADPEGDSLEPAPAPVFQCPMKRK